MSKSLRLNFLLGFGCCLLLSLLPWYVDFIAFFIFAVLIRKYCDDEQLQPWLVYGALAGMMLIFPLFLLSAELLKEAELIQKNFPGEVVWDILTRCLLPTGGFLGALFGHLSYQVIQKGDPRLVRMGKRTGFVVASIFVILVCTYFTLTGKTKHEKVPTLNEAFALTFWVLSLLVGGVLGSLTGAILSRIRYPHSSSAPPEIK